MANQRTTIIFKPLIYTVYTKHLLFIAKKHENTEDHFFNVQSRKRLGGKRGKM